MDCALQRIDEARLESDLAYRFQYLCDFIGMTPQDIDTILSARDFLAAKVDALVDAIYVKLFTYDCTKRHFVPRQSGYDVPCPNRSRILRSTTTKSAIGSHTWRGTSQNSSVAPTTVR